MVADLGFGDAGKGTMVDYIGRRGGYASVVRFNGGGQAAHNVVLPDGRHHTFRQFGSATFVPGIRTHLSRFMLVDPFELIHEAELLKQVGVRDPLKRLSIDRDALIVAPYSKNANRVRESRRGTGRHGSCAMGIGETMALSIARPDLVIRVGDLADKRGLSAKLTNIREYVASEFGDDPLYKELENTPAANRTGAWYADAPPTKWASMLHEIGTHIDIVDDKHLWRIARNGNLLFEGSQGVLLDEWRGFHPYTTWSTTTFDNALTLLREAEYDYSVEKIGVLRAYHTRHGEGPFPTEDAMLTKLLPDGHNDDIGPQGVFRNGWFDVVLAQYALDVCGGVDSLAITHLDRIQDLPEVQMAFAYQGKHEKFSRIPVNPIKEDLVAQAEITKLVQSSTPIYQTVGLRDERYADLIGQMLGTTISMTSYGQTAADKRSRARGTRAA
ncbi:MAG: adenylosuccinate synthetase [Candidatus Pacebacteria bacterium]|nr:adenylosuccinate synthetase [Candidatus Paceibacterota bacterium]